MESRKLARLWINAIVLGATADTAGYAFIVMLSRMLAVSDPESGPLTKIIFLSLVLATTAATTAVFGILTGRVLDCRLPALPMRNWVVTHALIGLFVGSMVALAYTEESQPWTAALIKLYVIGALVAAPVAGLLLGSIQAAVLRRTARGLRLWIGCSVLAGVCYLLRVPIDIYGPQTGIASDFATSAAGFFVSIVQGFVLLPAMLRLRPYGDHPIPIVFE